MKQSMIPILYSTIASGASGASGALSTFSALDLSSLSALDLSTFSAPDLSTLSGLDLSTLSAPAQSTFSGPAQSAPGPAQSTISGAQLVPVNYITISGPLPETPYDFNDGVLLKTEEELKQMDVSSLMLFSSTISTSISLEISTLLANQRVQGIYSILQQLSQSTIDGLDTEITVNTSLINSYTQYGAYLDGVSTSYVSTMQQYDLDIAAQLEAINMYNSTLSSYTSDYASSVSSIAEENTAFISAAVQYSSIYYTYLGYQAQYGSNTSTLDSVNLSLSTAVEKAQLSYRALQDSTIRWLTISGNLSSLYTDRTNIGSTLTQYRIDESRTYLNYASSVTALSTISSMYTAAVANELYAFALSTATQKTTDYADALERFQAAELLYNNSVPQGAPSAPSGSVQGNSALWAARSMAYQQLQNITADKVAAENATASLLNLAGLANTSAYETMLLGYDAQILAYATVEQNFSNYTQSSLQEVATFSSIYEQSLLDITMYTELISSYSSFYISSMIGASTLLGYSEIDASTITGDLLLYNAISWSISSLNSQYSSSMANYNSTLLTSTIFSQQYASTMSNVDMYTAFYTSTQEAVNAITAQLYGAGRLITVYNNTLFTNSSILNREILNTKIYDAQIKGYVNLQDESMYQYRETYCRSQREAYQYTYESNVFVAVQVAQTVTASQQALAAPGTTVTPVAADLTTPAISNSYAQLNSINNLLNNFSDIYVTFDTQALNVNNISTSIGNEGAALSTVDFYTRAQYFSTPMISNIEALVTNSCRVLASAQDSTMSFLTTYAGTQSLIDTQKVSILSSLTQFFTPADILGQNTEISSFLIQSIADANTILASQGITVTV